MSRRRAELCQKAWRGWRCTREPGHSGPCAALPSWWNLSGKVWMKARAR